MMPSWKRARVCSVQPGNVGRAPAPMTIVAISGAAYVRKPSELRRSTTEARDDDLPPHGPPVNTTLYTGLPERDVRDSAVVRSGPQGRSTGSYGGSTWLSGRSAPVYPYTRAASPPWLTPVSVAALYTHFLEVSCWDNCQWLQG